jgi:predicted DNA-binding transcriptional regulator AlpA
METNEVSFSTYEQLKARGDAPWCRDHLRRKWEADEYPKPVVLSRDRNGKPRRIAWIDEEIAAYKARKIAERDSTATD